MSKRVTPAVPQLLKVSEAARYLGVSRNFVQHLLETNAVPCVRLDGYKIRLAKIDLDAWVRLNRIAYTRAASRNKRLKTRTRKEPRHE